MSGGPRPLVDVLVGLAVLVASGAPAQGPQAQRPQYLPFAEFTSDDSAVQLSAKQDYNDAVERYNKTLYDYHVTLGQHDQLVDVYNRAGTAAEREKARAGAAPLRAKLQALRHDVTVRAVAVDQARRTANQVGVTLTR
jgi:hypothetical protein